MNISLVKYTQEFKHNGLSTWIGAEMTLEPGDDAMVAKKELKSFIYAAYYGDKVIPIEVPPPEPTELPSIQKEKPLEDFTLGEQIESCTEFKVLESYYLIVKNNPTLKGIYDTKKKELVAKESKEIIDNTEAFYDEVRKMNKT